MYLIINGIDKIPASKIEKGSNFIRVYDEEGNLDQIFQGIADFSKFSVEGGSFTEAPPDDITQLQLAVAELADLIAEGMQYGENLL